jgi:acyl carrier protein
MHKSDRTVEEDIKSRIGELVSDVLEIDIDLLDSGIPFAENKLVVWDSLKALDILAALEREFRIRIDESNLQKMDTLQNVFEVVSFLNGKNPQ